MRQLLDVSAGSLDVEYLADGDGAAVCLVHPYSSMASAAGAKVPKNIKINSNLAVRRCIGGWTDRQQTGTEKNRLSRGSMQVWLFMHALE